MAVDSTKPTVLLQVFEGKVRFANESGAITDVVGGIEGVTTRTAQVIMTKVMSAETMLKGLGELTISFGPPTRKLPPKCMIDSGLEFDHDLGYGWDQFIGATTSRGKDPNDPESSFVAGGSRNKKETWRMRLSNGKYEVTVCVGGVGSYWLEQGPHMVTVEEFPFVKGDMTMNGHLKPKHDIQVKDGELTVTIGGHGTDKKASDNTDDTVLNYLIIKRLK